MFLGSSVVEQTAVNRLVAGSNPARGATSYIYIYDSLKKLSRDLSLVKNAFETSECMFTSAKILADAINLNNKEIFFII